MLKSPFRCRNILPLRDMMNAEIRYYLITERNPLSKANFFPPMCGSSQPLVSYLGRYPQSLWHFLSGSDYYSAIIRHQINAGYFFGVIYSDTLQEHIADINRHKGIQLFLINLESEGEVEKIVKVLLENHIENSYYQPFYMSSLTLESLPNYIHSHDDFLKVLFDITQEHIPRHMLPFCVPISAGELKRDCFFVPAQVNMFTSQCIWGNWGVFLADDEMTKRQSIKIAKTESETAIKNQNTFDRQQLLVDQIAEIDFAQKISYKTGAAIYPGLGVPLFSPLILCAPFNSPLIKKMNEITKDDDETIKSMKRAVRNVLETEQTSNYNHATLVDDEKDNPQELIRLGALYSKRRMCFFDNVGHLHSNIKFSPYIRLPLIGKSIYSPLSTIGPNAGRQLISGGKAIKIHKKVKEIGEILSTKLMSPELRVAIKSRDCQVVAISDIPIEWTLIDGVPLGFSHDVCRVPESPNGGILSQYIDSKFNPMDIPEDILSKTLVVFGATEPQFAIYQQYVVELSQRLGFKTCVCTSAEQLKSSIDIHHPLFLVIDSHGGVDEGELSTFLMLGDEKLTGDVVIDKGIYAPLIFLSACSTAPTYTPMNIIANAFFQAGAKVVTSSYLPLNIDTSSITYIRLLNQLSQCSTEGIHCNWLAFISHILRTSCVMQPYNRARMEGLLREHERTQEQSELMAESMLFSNRRAVYAKISDGVDFGEKKYNIYDASPEYLFYSNLGRSDLIYFASYKKRHAKRVEQDSIEQQKL